MRYLVKARLKPGREAALRKAIVEGTLGKGSVAGDEYRYDLEQARIGKDGIAHWVETCFCATPLAEERPYWEEYFELLAVKDAHNRKHCRHENGTEPWACSACDCTRRLEERLQRQGKPFLQELRGGENNSPLQRQLEYGRVKPWIPILRSVGIARRSCNSPSSRPTAWDGFMTSFAC